MIFTPTEQRRGEQAAWGMRAMMVMMLGWMLLFASGCASQATTVEERVEEVEERIEEATGYLDALRAAGFKGRAVILWGNGHVAGQAFNISGSSGFVEVSFGDDDE